MARAKYTNAILKAAPVSPWLNNSANGIDYWLHVPTRDCGIHIRGLARLCGVSLNAIQSAIKNSQKTSQKVGAEVTNLRESELRNLLKDKVIFLEEVTNLSPTQQGGPNKVVRSNVCGIFLRYHARKGREVAIENSLKFIDFGIEQFIFIQVGFIPRPESIMLDDIEYLIAKETVQVNKSRQEEVQFFTNPITGECGIELQGLCYICGGVALKHVKTFLEAQQDPYVQTNHPQQIVKASICAKVLEHFGHQHKPRKTVAQHWAKSLNPIVPVLHQKTNYQAPAVTDRESMLQAEIANLKQENEHLRQLAHQTRGSGNMDWHDFLVHFLKQSLKTQPYLIEMEKLVAKRDQYLDCLIISKASIDAPNSIPFPSFPIAEAPLPDGLILEKTYNLISYKSCRESLTLWAVQELIGYYTGLRKDLRPEYAQQLPDAQLFQLYIVTTHYPQNVVEQAQSWQSTDKPGVYWLYTSGLWIQVIVTSQIALEPHNAIWNLLSDIK
ncbi:hypothetical protein TI05_15540, partial [Achromatium sp. WMS3]